MRNGVREELIPLVSVKGIGRVRARKLYNKGLKKPADLRKADVKDLAPLVGKKTAEKIKKEI